MSFKHLEMLAKEKSGHGDEWRPMRLEWVGPDDNPYAMKVEGAIYEPFKSGPRKGEPNWLKPRDGTKLTLWIKPEEIDARERQWERDTGLCFNCDGTGEKYNRTCIRCKGSTKAPQQG